ncbi:MAG TPA: amylo-alpha-1,6-glucosidase [Phycisphaerae bacterium]|nr:amylo-alpha-1,6-glucosidase [Phycisphaerae bacterium]HRR87456.1 amylo-alpha-1,6-glucosidase [Phycisphaerae bacterium]
MGTAVLENATKGTMGAPSGSPLLSGGLAGLLRREWLITNGRGGYASGTVAGVPTRRYHGLLVAAARPPLERWLFLSGVLERVGINGRFAEAATFEFDKTFHPEGYRLLTDFAVSNNAEMPWVRFTYAIEGVKMTKRIVLLRDRDEVCIRYRIEAPPGTVLSLGLLPFLAMRDFHALTRAFEGSYPLTLADNLVAVDAFTSGPRVWLTAGSPGQDQGVAFESQPHWWRQFEHREEAARGLDHSEDLFVPGWFKAAGMGSLEVEFRAVADFTPDFSGRPEPRPFASDNVTESGRALPVEERLREAAGAFVVSRKRPEGSSLTTILAGYHWFGDWGRDTFIALPGLLIETGRLGEARQVLEVFASAQQDGLIPNRFSDYGDGRDYNSVDASLWFIHAADAYTAASGDDGCWREKLGPACERAVEAFLAGTKFNIHVDGDGLVACGDASTQLTWMDAKCGDTVFTPRHGKPVEINALWYNALRLLSRRVSAYEPGRASRYADLAGKVEQAFRQVFWNEKCRCLYDVVRDGWADPAVRPNQILAVSLPYSMLDRERQRAVLAIVERQLLTPYGLRSLCPRHPSYAGRYEGNPYRRDSVYHQGTVWAWLMGPYVEAYLRVHDFSPEAKRRMRQLIQPLVDHLDDAGIGSVSEIFDGDPPHTPRGCIAQAWSVGELLRAWHMTEPVGG